MDSFRETADELRIGKLRLEACRAEVTKLRREWDSLEHGGRAAPVRPVLATVARALLSRLFFKPR